MQEYLSHLNEAQRQAVTNTKGPALVIAGAGSGKTRVLTYRITHLLAQGVKPWRILSLTFTNKAAREMKERIAEIIGKEKADSLWMGTFHSIFAKILRSEAKHLGFPSSFTIYDSADTKSIIKSIVKELQLDDKIYKPAAVYSRISKAKNNLVTALAYENNSQARMTDSKVKMPDIYRIYKIYTQRCRESGAMDFDDLLLYTNILFRDNPEVLSKYQDKFDYIMVDEYQDTNFSQYLIVKKLAEQHHNLCVVGDDAQSIYSFRGAKIENILNFQKDYKNFKLFKLEQNYRSTKNIVEAANSIISKNKNQIKKETFSENEEGNKIELAEALTDREEGFMVAARIFDSVYSEQENYSDNAILYRTNAQSRIFEEALRKRNIPYKIYGGTSFYQRKEIKDVLAYFKLVINKRDNESLKRIINYPKRGIGQTTIDRIESYAREHEMSMWDTILNIPKIPSADINLNSRAVNQVFGFANLIDEFTTKLPETDAYDMAHEIASKSGILQDLYKDKAPEAIQRHENVQELLNGIRDFTSQLAEEQKGTLDEFIESVSLLTDQDSENEEDNNRVTLMTIHSAKGLEFKNVFIVGVEERLFPSERASFSSKELEEERRLFYVAVTRAEKRLMISYTRQRYRWGQLLDCVPSRFIRDIDEKYLDTSNIRGEIDPMNQDNNETQSFSNQILSDKFRKISKTPKANLAERLKEAQNRKSVHAVSDIHKKLKRIQNEKQNAGQATKNPTLSVGAKVEHARFGRGEVISLEGDMPNTKATIKFAGVGTKQLLLKFAKLKVLG